MPLPVIEDVFRVTLLWEASSGAVIPRNVLHFRSPTLDKVQMGEAVLQSFHDARATTEPMELVSEAFSFDTVEVLPLDGSSSSAIVTDPTAVQIGQNGGNQVPAVSAIVSLRTEQRGPRGRGRVYLGPVGEETLTNGSFDTTAVTAAQGAWDDFLEACAENLCFFVVASYAHADSHDVETLLVESVAGTQRRRQNQLR